MSEVQKEKREAMARKIRALLAKAEDPAATEAEAMLASEKAKQLLDKYQLDLGAVGLMEEGFDDVHASSNNRESARIHDLISYQIGAFTETMALIRGQGRGRPVLVHYFGLKTDVIFAVWLSQSLEKYVIRKSVSYKAYGSNYYKSYRDGICDGICKKIQDTIDAREEKKQATKGTDLVPLDKSKIVEDEANNRMNIGSGRRTNSLSDINSEAFFAGHVEGQKASLSRPVEQDETPDQLEAIANS